jgi:tRNA C32,U32 (ribose-2'-O)-methylase TrmJ
MADGTDSLNVAVAAGVVLFELRRRLTEDATPWQASPHRPSGRA